MPGELAAVGRLPTSAIDLELLGSLLRDQVRVKVGQRICLKCHRVPDEERLHHIWIPAG